jgi:hypothetical protein
VHRRNITYIYHNRFTQTKFNFFAKERDCLNQDSQDYLMNRIHKIKNQIEMSKKEDQEQEQKQKRKIRLHTTSSNRGQVGTNNYSFLTSREVNKIEKTCSFVHSFTCPQINHRHFNLAHSLVLKNLIQTEKGARNKWTRKQQTIIIKLYNKFFNINSMRIEIIVKKQFNKVDNKKINVI